jgi:hypothetical protein
MRTDTLSIFGCSVLRSGATLLASALLATTAAADRVWVVDDDGGQGTDFVDVQPALNAAVDGDLVLVRPGLYSGFELVGKSVSIAADIDGASIVLGSSAVRDLPAGRSASLRGLRIVGTGGSALELTDCAGIVWLEACVVRGDQGDGFLGSPTFHPDGHAGTSVEDCASAIFMRCTFEGGGGADFAPVFSTRGDGGDGVDAVGARVTSYECVFIGGDGGSVASTLVADDGGTGGLGLALDAGYAMASDCRFEGGVGGIGGLVPGTPATCGAGGDGGDALGQHAPATGPVDVRLLACTFSPGAPGPGFDPPTCPAGSPGDSTALLFGSIDGLVGQPVSHRAASPVRAGQPITFTIGGEPGAFVVLGVAAGPADLFVPDFNGSLVLDANAFVLFPGFVGLDGALTSTWPGSVAVAPGTALTAYTQPALFVVSTLSLTVGSGSWLTVLDPTL